MVVPFCQEVKPESSHLGVLLAAGALQAIIEPATAQPEVGVGFSASINSSIDLSVDSVAWKASPRSYVFVAMRSSDVTNLMADMPKMVMMTKIIRLIIRATPFSLELNECASQTRLGLMVSIEITYLDCGG